jgi:Arc/MetJ-type ribon-helix-helix transcriptional regulator
MAENEKTPKWLTIRAPVDVRKAIEALVTAGEYPDISSFVLEAIQEKLDPNYGKARLKRQLHELLQGDPELVKELSEAVRFYQKL